MNKTSLLAPTLMSTPCEKATTVRVGRSAYGY